MHNNVDFPSGQANHRHHQQFFTSCLNQITITENISVLRMRFTSFVDYPDIPSERFFLPLPNRLSSTPSVSCGKISSITSGPADPHLANFSCRSWATAVRHSLKKNLLLGSRSAAIARCRRLKTVRRTPPLWMGKTHLQHHGKTTMTLTRLLTFPPTRSPIREPVSG